MTKVQDRSVVTHGYFGPANCNHPSDTNPLLHRLYLESADATRPILYSRIRFAPRTY